MGLLRDDRGQAIQVGAAILLGFVVIAITMYQVQVVPSQNAEIEFDHSQAVQDDVQDLRNAVTNAGARESSESVSVSLGTRFPARTIFVNPPPAIGTLRTVDAGNVTIHNAELADSSSYGADAEALLDDEHQTARIQYEPNYREYRGGPTTVVEHSLAYNQFDDATLSLSRQTAVRGDRLQLTLVDGDLQEEGARSVTVDAETISGPSSSVPIQPADGSDPIELRLPVATPEQWNESIGTSYSEGETDARVASYAQNGTLTVELDRDNYDLRMARVSVGADAERTDRYDVGGTDDAESDGAYAPFWEQDTVTVPVGTTSRTFTANTTPDGISGAEADFSFRDPDDVGVSEGAGTDAEFTGGSADYELRNFDGTGTLDLFVSGGGTSDAMTVQVVGGFVAAITGSNSPVQESGQLNVTADVENTGDSTDTQTLELLIDGSVVDSQSLTLDAGETQTRTLTWETQAGDAGEYDATVRTGDTSDSTTVEVTEDAPAAGPTIDSFDVQQRPGGQVGVRYSFQASAGDAALDTADVELRRTSDGTLVDQRQYALSGQQDSVNNEDFDNLGNGQEYELTLTVTDVDGNEATETRTQTAG